MALKLIKTELPEVVVFAPDVFKDRRGFFMETYNRQKYAELGLNRTFVQDNYSQSSRGIMRGLHYQLNYPQAKLVFVVRGEVFDVAVDIRRGSATFGRWTGQVLSAENNRQMFIPEGFAHGFFVLSETADFMYKCTEFYHPEDDHGIHCLDTSIAISWPVDASVLSDKDSKLSMLGDLSPELLPELPGDPAAGDPRRD